MELGDLPRGDRIVMWLETLMKREIDDYAPVAAVLNKARPDVARA